MEKKVRMADIAEKLNISVVSVSKALSDKEGVSEATREKIKSVARQMGYTPLRAKPSAPGVDATGNIGILVADHFFADSNFYAKLYRQLALHCNECGYAAVLEVVTANNVANGILPAIIQRKKVDGLIFMGQMEPEYINAVVQSGIPYILVDFYDERIRAMAVTSDNLVGGYQLTRHLLDSGRRKIGFVGSIHATSSIMDRFLGYTKALLRAGLPVRMDWVLEDRDDHGSFRDLPMPPQMPDAFLCSCDEVAYNLVQQLQTAGYCVPEDVAVVGYDDYHFALACKPRLTSYRVDMERMGRAAVSQLLSAIQGNATHGKIVIGGDLVRREST